MDHAEEILELWAERARTHKIHAALEITREGLVIGAGAPLAETKTDARGRPSLRLDDEPRAMALLATGYERPIDVHVVAKLRRACALWSEAEKALAHIHLAFAALPPCGPDEGLRIFAADRLIEKGVAPIELMKAQGFEPLALAYNEAEPRNVDGEWTRGAGGVQVAGGSEDNDRDRIARERRLAGRRRRRRTRSSTAAASRSSRRPAGAAGALFGRAGAGGRSRRTVEFMNRTTRYRRLIRASRSTFQGCRATSKVSMLPSRARP